MDIFHIHLSFPSLWQFQAGAFDLYASSLCRPFLNTKEKHGQANQENLVLSALEFHLMFLRMLQPLSTTFICVPKSSLFLPSFWNAGNRYIYDLRRTGQANRAPQLS